MTSYEGMKFKFEISAGGIVFKQVTGNKQPVTLWLITQHSQHKGWGFPKGLVGDIKKDETIKTAALREVREEGGIKAKIINEQPIKVQYMYRWPSSAKATKSKEDTLIKKTVYFYLMEYVSGDPKDHDWEVSEAKFVDADEVRKILTYKSDKEAFAKILKIV